MDWSTLNGMQQKLLRETILSAYTDPLEFNMFLAAELNKPALATIAAGATFEQQIFSLIVKAKAQGWTQSLVEALQRDRPDNPLVKNLPDAVRMTGTEQPRTAGHAQLSLEKIVRGGGFAQLREFSQKLAMIGEAVCRIEAPAGTPMGTGILVAPDLVVTNYHVVQQHIESRANLPEIACRFDYASDASGVADGVAIGLTTAGDWTIGSSPYDPAADTRGTGLPKDDCLDFAILKLSTPFGGERKPLSLSPTAAGIDQNLPVLIVQHPKGAPMSLAIGASLGLNENGSRLRYDTDTLPGSSGSAVFNQQLELMALHHAGDPSAVTRAAYNQGIPIAKIVAALRQREQDFQSKGIPKFWIS
ncbi:trypsin-like peptidase domain-containing protein [Bradyrhizobium prioriisuperbiae]|uniref:trypsin-like peptidase domain-containing protein n=1 Tax=Bradyrhizobium prioriisuperbiae TaxID=2854389 RepID=UPI0028E4A489|nr:trypsin-like peptidase domain-containing protein [Bradyrhizobium prioritasuperba]